MFGSIHKDVAASVSRGASTARDSRGYIGIVKNYGFLVVGGAACTPDR
jgi:hypothetical protein